MLMALGADNKPIRCKSTRQDLQERRTSHGNFSRLTSVFLLSWNRGKIGEDWQRRASVCVQVAFDTALLGRRWNML